MPTVVRPSQSKLTLTILSDAGAFHDLGDRLKREYPNPKDAPRVDLLKIPASLEKVLQAEFPGAAIDCPQEGRILYNLGASSAGSFLEKMQEVWTVETLPLGLCRYERAGSTEVASSPAPFRIRFHAPISYALGYLAATYGQTAPETRDRLVVAVVSDDPHLIPPLADARQRGLDARLVWFSGAVGPELSYFSGRNSVPMMLIEPVPVAESPAALSARGRDSAITSLDGVLKSRVSRR